MTKYIVQGGSPLFGEVHISGAKNAAVAILPAALLVDGVCRIENIPQISDVTVLLKILEQLGAKVRVLNRSDVELDCRHIVTTRAPQELAHKLGVPFENIFILANGDIFEISKGSARVTGFTNGDAVLIDGASVGEVDNSVLRERKLLSDDGVVAISLAVNRKTGAMMAQPVVSAMGFLYDSEHVKIEAACRQHAANAVARIAASGKKVQEAVSSGQLQGQLRSFLYERAREEKCDIAFYGHTHEPDMVTGVPMLVNPGAVCREQMAMLEVEDGRPRVKMLVF